MEPTGAVTIQLQWRVTIASELLTASNGVEMSSEPDRVTRVTEVPGRQRRPGGGPGEVEAEDDCVGDDEREDDCDCEPEAACEGDAPCVPLRVIVGEADWLRVLSWLADCDVLGVLVMEPEEV